MFHSVIISVATCLAFVPGLSTTTEDLFLVRNLDGSQGLCTLDASVVYSSSLGLNVTFESNECSEMQTFYFFIANETSAITEVQLYSNSSATLNQYEAPYNVISSDREIDLNQTLTVDSKFTGNFSLTLDLLPVDPVKYNLAVLMSSNSNPNCSDFLSYYYLINAPISLPDLMVLDKYKVIGLNE